MRKEYGGWLTPWWRISGAIIAAAILMGAVTYHPSPPENPFPSDVRMRCPAGTAKKSFADWFADKKPTAGGLVDPPDSTKLNVFGSSSAPSAEGDSQGQGGPNYYPDGGPDFYRWAYQMFLHVTSPVGGPSSQPIFASPEFYALSPANPNTGWRSFVSQTEPGVREMEIRKGKPAADDYSIIHDSEGNRYIVVPQRVSPTGNRLVTNGSGHEVETGMASLDASGRGVFLNPSGQPIPGAQPVMAPAAKAVIAERNSALGSPKNPKANPSKPAVKPADLVPVYKLAVRGGYAFIDTNGSPVSKLPTELTQPDGGVQLTRSYQSKGKSMRSLVYYTLAYNDAFAYFRTLVEREKGKAGNFPDDPTSIAALDKYAKQHGHSIAHPDALVIELKMAWVEAAAVSNPKEYITVTAKIPEFNTSNPNRWVQNGTKVTKLALVGMHIVGSTYLNDIGIWATFEHLDNAPNFAYRYFDTKGKRVTVPAERSGKEYLFGMPDSEAFPYSSGASIELGKKAGEMTITGVGGHPVRGTSVYRLSPFGSPSDEAPNNVDRSPAASNTTLLSLNRDVFERMPDGDPRKYYFLGGATWDTFNDDGPELLWTQTAKPWHFDGYHYRNIEGTPFVANSTMETFEQAPSYARGGATHINMSGGGGPNIRHYGNGQWANQRGWVPAWREVSDGPAVGCFSCHTGYNIAVQSHVFGKIKPLW